MLRPGAMLSCWLLLLLHCNSLLTVSAQTNSNSSTTALSNGTTTATPAIQPTTSSTTAQPTVLTTSTPDSEHGSDCSMYIVVAAVLGTLFFLTLLLLVCVSVCFFCNICSKRNEKEFEIKQYVFEEGVEHPKLWVDPNAVDEKPLEHQPDIWEVSTFSPSPKSKDATMPMPDIQTNNANGNAHPIPVQQPVVLVKRRTQSGRFRPKRVAPPPPKGGKRRRRFGRKTEETVVYAVPAPYILPISQKKNGYDTPKSHLKEQGPHVYKSIDTAQVKPPNPYAGLVVRPTNN